MAAVKFLLAKDEVDPNSCDNAGRSAFSYAVPSWQLETCQILVKVKNIDINSTDEQGQTPLLEVARLLKWVATEVHYIRAEIFERDRNFSGCANWVADEVQQAMIDGSMAELEKYKTIFNLLVDKRADHGAEDDDGNTLESYQQSERRLWESYQANARRVRKETCQRNSPSRNPCCFVALHSEWPGPSFSSLLW
ncbi:hypothetical protein FALCPG4_017277 [Fusarium falciforme]